MKAWLAGRRHWLVVERLPGYAHDLNPMELVWGNVKATELANLCPDTIDEADTAAHAGLHRVGSDYRLCFNFLHHTGLRLWQPSLKYRKIFFRLRKSRVEDDPPVVAAVQTTQQVSVHRIALRPSRTPGGPHLFQDPSPVTNVHGQNT